MAANVESPVTPQAPGWSSRLPKDERIFLWVILASASFMTAFVLAWLFWTDHNVPTASHATTPEAFAKQVAAFVARYGNENGQAVVPPGKDAYLLAARYTWYPELVLKSGVKYRIWMSSADTLHGFSLVGGNQNINLEVAPNHAYGALLTPDKPGTYLIVCNEYCGLQHHTMLGRIHVVR
jgi:cytochrome c oxidase subunit 2